MNLNRYKDVVVKPLIEENPITLQILGICSALAVTNNLSVTSDVRCFDECCLFFKFIYFYY